MGVWVGEERRGLRDGEGKSERGSEEGEGEEREESGKKHNRTASCCRAGRCRIKGRKYLRLNGPAGGALAGAG